MEVMSLCETARCLPGPGGLLDQDPYWVRRMKVWYRVQAQKAEVEEAKRSKKPLHGKK